MSFDKNVLKLNNAEGRRLSLEAKSEAPNSSPKVLKEELGKVTVIKTHNVIDKRKSVENTNPIPTEKRKSIEENKSIEKNKSVGESIKRSDQLEESSSGYCLPYCDKPERDDMLGCDFCDAWYHPECIGIVPNEVAKVTQSQSWKCPKCIEEDMMKRKKIFSKKTAASTSKLANKTPTKTIQKPVAKPAPQPKLKSTSINKRKSISPKKVVRKVVSSDSSSSSSSSESEGEIPAKRKSKVVSKKMIAKKETDSSSDDSDIDSDESDAPAGKIIRIPVDRADQHKYYK
jgi:hypothetical protein